MPVSYRSGRLFRRITVLLAWLPLILMALMTRPEVIRRVTWRGEVTEWGRLIVSPWSFGIALVGLVAGTGAAAAATAALFRARHLSQTQRGRAQAIGCYSCAPLALLPVLIGACALAIGLSDHSVAEVALERPPVRAVAIAGGLVLLWLRSSLWMLRKATGCGTVRLIASGLSLPVIWTALIVLVPAVFELLVAFVAVIVVSFS